MALSTAQIGVCACRDVHFISENAMGARPEADLGSGIDAVVPADDVHEDQIETAATADCQLCWHETV
jgi:hypothetical protein